MMRIVRILAVLAPMLAFAASDSTAAKRGWLGVYTEDLSKPMLVALNIDHGVLVTDVAEESPAAKAGMEAGDVITSLDGDTMTDGSALRWAVRDRPEKKVVVKFLRRGKKDKLDVTLGIREEAEQTFNFEWPAMPREALLKTERALKEVGPKIKLELERSDLSLDSLRDELQQLKKELGELRKKVAEKQKGE
jgi:membrane-associated protease RseP (regulator of RpoE activity)